MDSTAPASFIIAIQMDGRSRVGEMVMTRAVCVFLPMD